MGDKTKIEWASLGLSRAANLFRVGKARADGVEHNAFPEPRA